MQREASGPSRPGLTLLAPDGSGPHHRAPVSGPLERMNVWRKRLRRDTLEIERQHHGQDALAELVTHLNRHLPGAPTRQQVSADGSRSLGGFALRGVEVSEHQAILVRIEAAVLTHVEIEARHGAGRT